MTIETIMQNNKKHVQQNPSNQSATSLDIMVAS